MGSYLTIVNDTKDPWACKIGPDEKALEILSIIAMVVGTIAAVVSGMGYAAPGIVAAIAGKTVTIMGMTTTTLGAIATGVKSTVSYVKMAVSMSDKMYDQFSKDGYVSLQNNLIGSDD